MADGAGGVWRGGPGEGMTAKIQKQEVARYLELGALGVIGKPFDP